MADAKLKNKVPTESAKSSKKKKKKKKKKKMAQITAKKATQKVDSRYEGSSGHSKKSEDTQNVGSSDNVSVHAVISTENVSAKYFLQQEKYYTELMGVLIR